MNVILQPDATANLPLRKAASARLAVDSAETSPLPPPLPLLQEGTGRIVGRDIVITEHLNADTGPKTATAAGGTVDTAVDTLVRAAVAKEGTVAATGRAMG